MKQELEDRDRETLSENEKTNNASVQNKSNHVSNIEFKQLYKIYKHKMKKLSSDYYIKGETEKFWELLEHNFEGEIEKKSFIVLFTKIYKLILPIYNYDEVASFLENEWLLASKGKASMDLDLFSQYLFKFIHTWAVHINRDEYLDLLKLIYQRITKYIKSTEDGKDTVFTPSIRVKCIKLLSPKEYDEKTWESCESHENLDETLMEYPPLKEEEDAEVESKRPFMNEEYNVTSNIIIYNEEVFFKDEESLKNLKMCETVKAVLLNDDEIVIFGCPSQYILTYFKNNIKILQEQTLNMDYPFKISDYKPYEKHTFYFTFDNNSAMKEIIEILEGDSHIILQRDVFCFPQPPEIPPDFVNEELSMFNNLCRNKMLDRVLNFQEVKLPNNVILNVNIDSLIINSSHKKAIENVVKNERIGVCSQLWKEKIYEKFEHIIKHKFALVHKKLLYFSLNQDSYSYVIEAINKEIDEEEDKKNSLAETYFEYFKKFESKTGINYDKWDSDYDLIEEANRKAPVILVIGVPLSGKSSICKKLAEDLNMVYLHPDKFFEKIMAKVAKFEEDMQNWDDGGNDADEVDADGNPNPNKLKKKEKPGLKTVLSKLELDVYNDLVEGRAISEENMINLHKHIIHSDLAYSRGLIIDQNSSVSAVSFAELLLTGHYGNVKIDYVVNLTIPQEELDLRIKTIKFNLKTLNIITQRDIELIIKPKKKKKEILEDEEVEEEEENLNQGGEEGNEPELSDEEKEKIPKESDLIDITDFANIYKQQLDFYLNVQFPIFKEYFSNLKKNYYLEVNLIGLDYDDAAELIKTKLDFTQVPRNIPTSIEPAGFKDLLMSAREGILPYRRWSLWKQIDPVALMDDFLILNGNPDFAAEYCQRVFVFVSEENKNKFCENPKKYLQKSPQVPKNYRVCIFGPGKSGKNTIADMLSEMFGWKKLKLNEIYEEVKEYQRNLEEPELNSVYTSRIHFSANEFKDLQVPPKKGEKKSDNFCSKIVFMLDHLGIKMDKKKTFSEHNEEKQYMSDKLSHLFRKMEKEREEQLEIEREEQLEIERKAAEEEALLNKLNNPNLINEENATENVENNEEEDLQSYNSQNNVISSNVLSAQHNVNEHVDPVVVEEQVDPFPPEEEYIIEDLKSDQFYYAFNDDGTYPRPGGFILINCPNSQEEIDKFLEFNIVFDKVIYLTDQSEEPLKGLAMRKNPNFINLDEEKQANEIEKIKAEVAKIEEHLTAIKEKYNRNNEECVVEINCVDKIDNIKLKLMQLLNPFYTRVDDDSKIFVNADVNPEEKTAIQKGEFGIFCPVTYKDERWLYYAPEEFEVQVNQRRYRFASEKEMEIFKRDPTVYLNVSNTVEEDGFTSMTPVSVLPPHIFITGIQGGGVSFYTSLLSREFKLKKRELKKEFMDIWENQSRERKEIRVEKKREELVKKNEEIKQNNLTNPDQEPQELLDINTELANDPGLDDEGEGFTPVDNDKNIFRRLFSAETASIYDATWYDINEKIQTSLLEFLIDSRRVPNVIVIVKVTLKTILDRHLHLDQIKAQHKSLEEISIKKKKEAIEKIITEKKEARLEELKQELLDAEGNNESFAELEKAEGNNSNKDIAGSSSKAVPDLKDIEIKLNQEEEDEIMLAADPELPELETLIAQEKEKLVQRYENNMNFLNTLIEQLKEKLIPVIEVSNDLSTENVYKNLLYHLQSFIRNRANLIEKQLVVSQFPELSLRKSRDLISSQVYKLSAYGLSSPINMEKLVPRTSSPLLYRDRLYFFNNEQERNCFAEEPLTFRTGREFPLDSYPASQNIAGVRNLIYTIGAQRSGRSTIAKMLEELGYYRLSLRRACYDILNMLQDCLLKRELFEVLTTGSSLDDNLATRILSKRISLQDLVNKNIVIDGFPYTLSQARLLTEIDSCMKPSFVLCCECDDKTLLKRMKKQEGFKGLTQVIHERFTNTKDHLKDILQSFKNLDYDIKYFNTEKSLWYLKDLLLEILEKRRKNELLFASNYIKNQPALLNYVLTKRILKDVIQIQKENPINYYSPVSLKIKNEFSYNKYANDCINNYIVYYKNAFHFLKSEEEFHLFSKNPKLFESFLNDVKFDIKPPKVLNFEKIASISHVEPTPGEEEVNHSISNSNDIIKNFNRRVYFEYQSCCPISIVHDKLMKEGKIIYIVLYKQKYFKFLSADKLKKFCVNPEKYFRMNIPVKKVLDDNQKQIENQINFENTVNYLEANFASLITKGMLELSKNRIKFPYLSVKETSIKYLALFLKANNPLNNEYSKMKYSKKFEEFLKNSKVPFDLLNVYENHQNEKNPLKKELIRKQLNNLSSKYDDLMDKAKTLKNTRFVDFFKKTE